MPTLTEIGCAILSYCQTIDPLGDGGNGAVRALWWWPPQRRTPRAFFQFGDCSSRNQSPGHRSVALFGGGCGAPRPLQVSMWRKYHNWHFHPDLCKILHVAEISQLAFSPRPLQATECSRNITTCIFTPARARVNVAELSQLAFSPRPLQGSDIFTPSFARVWISQLAFSPRPLKGKDSEFARKGFWMQ